MANSTLAPTLFGECFEDRDCPGRLERCYYASFPWVGDEGNICACENWFGYIGKDCDEFGPGSAVYILSTVVSSIVVIIGIAITSHSLYLLFGRKMKRTTGTALNDSMIISETDQKVSSPRKYKPAKKTKREISSVEVLGILLFCTLLITLAHRVAMFIAVMTPHHIAFREEQNINGLAKAHFIEAHVEKPLEAAEGILVSFSLLNFSLIWIMNLQKASRRNLFSPAKLARYRFFLVVLNLVYLLVFILAPRSLIGAIVIVLTVLIVISYYIGERYTAKVYLQIHGPSALEPMTTEKGSWMSVLLKRMTMMRRVLLLGTMIAVVGAILYLTLSLDTWRKNCPSDQVCMATVGSEMMIFGIIVNEMAAVLFLHETAAKPLSSSA